MTDVRLTPMRERSSNTVVVEEGVANLTRRSDSKYWQLQYKAPNSKVWIRKGTGTGDLKKATSFAVRALVEAQILAERGIPVTSKKFKQVAKLVLQELLEMIAAGTNKPSDKDYVSALNRYLIEFYGKYNVDSITPQIVADFHTWRTAKAGRELTASTQNNHNAAFNLVIKKAIDLRYMTELQRPAIKNTGAATGRRPEFTFDELKQLISTAESWVEKAPTKLSKQVRQVLRYYVPFMATTGMRTGTEGEVLRWRHFEKTVDADGNTQLVIHLPKAKTKPRQVIAGEECWAYLEQLRQLNPRMADMTLADVLAKGSDDFVFALPDGTYPKRLSAAFENWLEYAQLVNCRYTGDKRTLYCLRHYYATQKILSGVSGDWLAAQMGTSTDMLEKHYKHVRLLVVASSFSGATLDASEETKLKIKMLQEQRAIAQSFMQLAELSTGITLSLSLHNTGLKDDFDERLKEKLKQQG